VHASQVDADDPLGGVTVASVATGFPSGQYPLHVRLDDTKRAIEAGADEVDMVISRGAALHGDWSRVADEVAQTKAMCVSASGDAQRAYGHAHLKVILETGELETYDAVRRASDVCMRAGLTAGDFIKTSTGKVSPAATMGVTLVMLEAIRDFYRESGVAIGMKPAGGIRTSKDALHYLMLLNETLGDGWMNPGLFRFGASSLLNDLLMQLARRERGVYMSPDDFSEA
jgi:deoxyribose-phosphate aldolase